jgi:diamine N-acetyltransferase
MFSTDLTIRPATAADAPQVAALLRYVFTWAYGSVIPVDQLHVFLEEQFTAAQIDGDSQRPGAFIWLAEVAGTLAGVIRLEPNQPHGFADFPQAIELTKCYVLPEYHGTRVATALVHTALRLARETQWPAIWLCVWQENLRAVAFYQKHGFRIVGKLEVWVGTTCFDDYVMLRGLDD